MSAPTVTALLTDHVRPPSGHASGRVVLAARRLLPLARGYERPRCAGPTRSRPRSSTRRLHRPGRGRGLDRAAAAGVTAIKVPLFWNEVAPSTARGIPPGRSSDPAYNWTQLDTQLRLIRAHGLEPIVYIAGAPAWARDDRRRPRPDPAQYRAFALAAVRRYSGRPVGLPRVRFWQAWNEPNKVAGPRAKKGTAGLVPDARQRVRGEAHTVPGQRRDRRRRSRRSGSRPRSRPLDVHARRALRLTGPGAHATCIDRPFRRLVDRPVHGRRPDAQDPRARRCLGRRAARDEGGARQGRRLGDVVSRAPRASG